MNIEDLKREGYYSIREIPGQGLCGMMKFVFTTGLVIGLESWGYKGRYCYSSAEEAQKALDVWDGTGDPSGPWIKYKGEGGERSNNEEGCKNCSSTMGTWVYAD